MDAGGMKEGYGRDEGGMQEPSATAAGRERAPAARLSAAEPGFRDAHRESEPKNIPDPFEFPFLRGNPPFSPQNPGWGPSPLSGG